MSTQLLDQARYLAVPPVLTRGLAKEVIGASPARDGVVNTDAQEVLRELMRRGVLTGNGVMRFSASLRWDLLGEFKSEQLDQYRIVASLVSEYTQKSEDDDLAAALGTVGLSMLQRTMQMAADPAHEDEAFDALASTVVQSASEGRLGDAGAAVRLLSEIPYATSRDRQLLFLNGMAEWNERQRESAVVHLEKVLNWQLMDRIHAISAHLVAVDEAGRGELRQARMLAQESVRLLDSLGDRRGLAMVLNTLGGIERELESLAELTGRTSHVDALSTADRAVGVAEQLGPHQLAIAMGRLMSVLYRRGDYEGAREVGEEALDRLQGSGLEHEMLEILRLLGSASRAAGDLDDAEKHVAEGIQLAESIGDTTALAQLLNVASSIARKLGTGDAVKLARRSVQLGEELEDPRHLAHSYHTLARALIGEDDLSSAVKAAEQSLSLLRSLGDRRGVRMVESTLGLIREAEDL